jgi:hypothetical protein
MRNYLDSYAYKVRAVSGDGTTSWSVNYSNQVSVHGLHIEKKPGVAIEEVPLENTLVQNFPNPFNPTTSISYRIAEPSHVTIVVYDRLGQKVRTLVNELKGPGYYDVQFFSGGLSSGLYFYKLQTESFVEVRKMLLMK